MSEPRYIVVPDAVFVSIRTARADRLPRETGGFLIGHRRGAHLEIVDCTRQAPGDVATQTSFSRLSPKHAEDIDAAWRGSEGRQSIIGDWHSHPIGDALPSSTDKRAWRTLAKAMKAPGIGVIAASDEVLVFYFSVRWGGLQVRPCSLEEDANDELVFAVD